MKQATSSGLKVLPWKETEDTEYCVVYLGNENPEDGSNLTMHGEENETPGWSAGVEKSWWKLSRKA